MLFIYKDLRITAILEKKLTKRRRKHHYQIKCSDWLLKYLKVL